MRILSALSFRPWFSTVAILYFVIKKIINFFKKSQSSKVSVRMPTSSWDEPHGNPNHRRATGEGEDQRE